MIIPRKSVRWFFANSLIKNQKMKKTIIHLSSSVRGDKIRNHVRVETDKPVIFLTSPMRHQSDWQETAIKLFLESNREVFVVSPISESSQKPELAKLAIEDNQEYHTFRKADSWEKYYLDKAAVGGCIILWLPKELGEVQDLHRVDANITMLAISEWISHYSENEKIRLVIGTDIDFPQKESRELRSELPAIQIFNSLEETIEAALKCCED